MSENAASQANPIVALTVEILDERIAVLNTMLDDLTDALVSADGHRVLDVLDRIDRTFGPDITETVIDGLVAVGFATRRTA